MAVEFRIKSIECGPRHALAWLTPMEGTMKHEPKAFLSELKGKNPAANDRFMTMFQEYCKGTMLRGNQWKPLTYEKYRMFEFKDNASQSRVLGVSVSYKVGTENRSVDILLVGFGGKKEKKIDPYYLGLAKRRGLALEGYVKDNIFSIQAEEAK